MKLRRSTCYGAERDLPKCLVRLDFMGRDSGAARRWMQ
jgi:hypothetical protein